MKKQLLTLVLPIMLTPTQFGKQGIKQKCNFIKIDVEGSELLLVSGALVEKKEEIIKKTGNSLLSSTNLKWIVVLGARKERPVMVRL